MKLLPFRKRERKMVRYVKFWPPRDLAEYGFDGAKPKKQDGTASGFLLPWAGIDAERDRRVRNGPAELVVEGEYVDDATGIRRPSLAVNPAWMEGRGWWRESEIRDGRVVFGPWRARA